MISRVRVVRVLISVASACLAVAVAGGAVGADETVRESSPEARMDALWLHRDTGSAVQELVLVATGAVTTDPQDYEAEWRLARAYFWVAYTQSNRVAKKAMAGKAMEWAERARAQRPNRVEAHYLYAIAIGQYADTIGIVQAVMDGVAGKFEAEARRAYEIDRDYSYGAPGTVLGRYYFMLPWPQRDLELSRRYLEDVVARHPSSLVARCYLAETYYELGQRGKAREQLAYVLTHDPAPGTELDLPPPKVMARETMQRWFPDAVDVGGQASR